MVFRHLINHEFKRHRINCELDPCKYSTYWRDTTEEAAKAIGAHLKKKHPEQVSVIGDIEDMFGKL